MKHTLNELWHSVLIFIPKLFIAAIVFLIFYIIGRLLRSLFRKKLINKLNSSIVATFTGEVLFWIALLFGSFAAAGALGFKNIAGSILAGAGISAVIFGFAFKDILENFLAGFIIAFQKPFKVGDIIEVQSFKGPVRALELRSTQMRLADGRDIWIPNGLIVKGVLTNYTRDGLLRQEFVVTINMASDVEKARNMILDFIDSIPNVLKKPSPNVLVDEITATGVKIRVLFWINQGSTAAKADPEARGESIKSHVIRGTKDVLMKNDFGLVHTMIIEQKK